MPIIKGLKSRTNIFGKVGFTLLDPVRQISAFLS